MRAQNQKLTLGGKDEVILLQNLIYLQVLAQIWPVKSKNTEAEYKARSKLMYSYCFSWKGW